MKASHFILSVAFIFCSCTLNAQDSAKVASTFKTLLSLCKNVDFSDPKVQEIGTFYKAAPYIVYQGDDKARKWKVPANYQEPKEKEQVNQVCYRINETVNQDTAYVITGYKKQKESEGEWHVLMISYIKKGKHKNAIFAFLKIKDKFLLGDID